MNDTNNHIGKSIQRIDALDKVTGRAKYAGDLDMVGMLHMKVVFAERPHARIRSIDSTSAKALAGVVAVFSAADIPNNEYGLQKQDQPVLCGPGSGKAGADVVRFVGDQVALIVAESAAIAEEARKLIKIDYEDLPVVSDPVEAMKAGAPIVHPELGDTNICVHDRIRKGNIDEGFRSAAVIIEGDYDLPFQEHAYMEPEAGLAYIDEEGRITVTCAGQWTHEDQEQIAHALEMPLEKIRVIYPTIGGAFGGREDMSVQIILALATWKTGKPVKIVWSRRESIIGHGKRHPMRAHAKWGASGDGKLVAAEMTFIADAGAYFYTTNKVLGNTTIVCSGPYSIPNVKVDTYGVYTNNLPTAAFRGFGAPQGIFVAETQMNKLAEALKLDPVEMRIKNALMPGDTLNVGTAPMDRVSAHEVIETTAKRAGWKNEGGQWVKPRLSPASAAHKVRGMGFAAAFKNIGFSFGYQENSWAKIEVFGEDAIEKAVLYMAGAEVGQGTHSAMTQIAADTLGIAVEKVETIVSDTATTKNSGSASASRLTYMAGNAVLGAAKLALSKWQAKMRPAVGEFIHYPPITTPFDEETGYSTPNFCYAYTAEAVEAEVDTETGEVSLIRVISVNDVGRAINPRMVTGQIEGAVVQAQGYALMENFIMRDGKVLTDSLSTYLIPTIFDIPQKIDAVMLELPDPLSPLGARGVGEPPFLPLAPAVVAAIHDAIGIWIDRIPATAESIATALAKQGR